MRDAETGSSSGLNEAEAKELHRMFMSSFVLFTLVAIGAHILVWMWRPWFPGPDGYAELTTGVNMATQFLTSYLS
jgi:light-harvesting complex 1 beta chain